MIFLGLKIQLSIFLFDFWFCLKINLSSFYFNFQSRSLLIHPSMKNHCVHCWLSSLSGFSLIIIMVIKTHHAMSAFFFCFKYWLLIFHNFVFQCVIYLSGYYYCYFYRLVVYNLSSNDLLMFLFLFRIFKWFGQSIAITKEETNDDYWLMIMDDDYGWWSNEKIKSIDRSIDSDLIILFLLLSIVIWFFPKPINQPT